MLDLKTDCPRNFDNKGFTLIEMMVVVLIIGALSAGVVTQFASSANKVKGVSFALRNDFNFVRAEAVKRNADVTLEFVNGTADLDGDGDNDDGYYIYVDDDGVVASDNDPGGGPFGTYTAGADELIKTQIFRDDVAYYDPAAVIPGGPPLDADDGITFVAGAGNIDFISFGGDGLIVGVPVAPTPDLVRLYVPGAKSATVIEARVTSVGRVRLHRWGNGAWD